jgi:hypothetical protein
MPMRKLKIEAESQVTSPIYRGPSPIPFHLDLDEEVKKEKEEAPVFSFSCDSPPSTAEAVGVWLDQLKVSKGETQTELVEVEGEEGVVVEVLSSQVLEVHVETFD